MPEPASVATSRPTGAQAGWNWLRSYLPEGRGLPAHEWGIRHRAVLGIIFLHAVGLPIFAMARGWLPAQALGEGVLLAVIGVAAMTPQLSRKARSGLAAMGCVISSAMVVQFWGGTIEGHFHFFVVVALISLYQDWLPFLVAIGFVALDHGVTGTLIPGWVFNHPAALANPWGWAAIHASFVLAECVALVVVWKTNEQARAETTRILRSTGEGMLGVDADCVITFVNPAAAAMTGLAEHELVGKPLYGLVRGADGRPAFAPDVLRQNPGAFSSQAWLARPNGAKLPIELLCTPIEGKRHEEGAVVAMRDLTERLQTESERILMATQENELQQLREVNLFKARFMNMAAHELNTPLTPIKVQMHLLKNESKTHASDPRRHSIEVLDRNFARLSGLVQDLLDSTRLQANRLPTALRPTDLRKILVEAAESFRPLANVANTELVLGDVGPLHCQADGGRISQVISNLLTNAFKFTPPGGVVRIQPAIERSTIRIAIHDTGLGLTENQIVRLFQPFEQVHDSQVASHHGSGLGLYISRGIIESHLGKIWCESPGPGKGSSFILEIPKQPAKDTPVDAATS